jgi:hypothetical protein
MSLMRGVTDKNRSPEGLSPNAHNYIIRNLESNDCEEVRQLWSVFGYTFHRYSNEIMHRLDPNSTFIAIDIKTGIS